MGNSVISIDTDNNNNNIQEEDTIVPSMTLTSQIISFVATLKYLYNSELEAKILNCIYTLEKKNFNDKSGWGEILNSIVADSDNDEFSVKFLKSLLDLKVEMDVRIWFEHNGKWTLAAELFVEKALEEDLSGDEIKKILKQFQQYGLQDETIQHLLDLC
jgi:hypothetical protein